MLAKGGIGAPTVRAALVVRWNNCAAPHRHDGAMSVQRSRSSQPQHNAVDFARTARVLAGVARQHGFLSPSFRSPPRLVGVDRSLRRFQSGASVAVAVRNRPWQAVLADMIEGVVVANGLHPPAADRLRAALWEAVATPAQVIADVA